MLFILKVGTHYDRSGRVYRAKEKGNNVVESKTNLCKVFPNKFERVVQLNDSDIEHHIPPKTSEGGGEDVVSKLPSDVDIPSNGEDVSMYYPLAEKKGVKVFRLGDTFAVRNAKGEVLNEAPMRVQEVKSFLKQLKV